MLDPEYLERAGDLVCGVYSDMEADMCDVLVRAMLAGDISEWRAQTALALLAQGQAPQLRMVLERYRGRINKAVRDEVEAALERSDAHDLAIVKRALGVELPKVTTQQVAGVVYTVCQMLERDNVDLMSGARDAFYRESSWAVTQVASGLMSPDEAVRQATRRLARGGIEMVQYRDPTTGDKTVRNHVDVAVRRHIRSQLQQACAERTMQVCELTGCEFVEVSSHYGARPSHQEWEGRVYSLKGRVTVDGKTYEDFGEGTGYYGTGPYAALGDRLCGVNCRHHWGPWFPGLPRAYHPNPQHPSGKSNAEIYDLTQKQRALERGIRDTKRELKAAEAAYEADPTLKRQAEASRVRESLKRQQERLAKLCDENKDVLKRQANREGPIDTRGSAPKGSSRTVDEYLAQPSVASRMERAGASKTATKRELSKILKANDLSGRDFPSLTRAEQGSIGDAAISGAIRGNVERMNKHAERYYESVRRMDRGTVVGAISQASGLTREEAGRAFSHLFLEKHDLGENGVRRFYADYEISQSVQRILLGRGVCEHDRILFRHELEEATNMAAGLAQGEAHDMANLRYNYQEATIEWVRRGARPGD